ncbi:CHASE2 domain-containing protein [Parachitinimonas caeni]|uniref:Adenylate/guanylate cyclase domain-containing protein n=1 Tax=Parachitinimonas caeni TaxID=3031301 RepID=A0ABT7DT12_9NEIS|nr:adenylate/guanylate cyclase domain-containing protein [Parachitinimonas caeni]MDK2123216.1 adenylate/guanylate cyclase domain-containing protein [Parachitinimonas caeni]
MSAQIFLTGVLLFNQSSLLADNAAMWNTIKKHWLQLTLSVMVLVYLLGYAGGYWTPHALRQFDLWLYDARMVATMPGTVDPRVVIVDIDEKSLAKLGRWPWRRDIVAKLVDQLFDRYQVGVVGFDVVFAEPDDSSGLRVLRQLAQTDLKSSTDYLALLPELEKRYDYDQLLAERLKGRQIVLGYYYNVADSPRSGQLPKPVLPAGMFKGRDILVDVAKGYGANLPILAQSAATGGHFVPSSDIDGVTRKVGNLVEIDGQYYESLSMAMVRAVLGNPPIEPHYPKPLFGKSYNVMESLRVGPISIPVDDQGKSLIPYRGRNGSFPYVSASDVYEGTVDLNKLKGRLVLLGTTAPGLKDLRVSPVGPVYPGVEIHANLISGMLDGAIPDHPLYISGAEILQLLFLGIVLSIVLVVLDPFKASITTGVLLILVVTGNFLLWRKANVAFPLASAITLITVLFALNMAYGYFFEARKKRQMASLFGQYVPPELVGKMAEDPEKYTMDGQSRELTVLFSDVRSFTTISESMDPKELSRFMNEFLTTLSEVIRSKYLGTIDKYMGDCVMAFWGAPIYDPDHATNAVLAGIEMQRAIAELGPKLKEKGWPEIHIGVGINTGRMTVGDMGSQIRKAYTVMGDAVNLASRLEGITKQYGVGMIVGEATRNAVGDTVIFRELDRVKVKGKEDPVAIFEPVGRKENVDKAVQNQIQLFHQALKHYRTQNWDMAELQLINLKKQQPDCKLYSVYLDRIKNFRHTPPPPNWDGVYEFDTK